MGSSSSSSFSQGASSSSSGSRNGSSSNWNSSSNNGSTSSGRKTMTSEEFLKRNINYKPKSAEEIKEEAFKSVVKNGQPTSNISSHQPSTTGLRNRSSSSQNSSSNSGLTSSYCETMSQGEFLKNNTDYKPSSAQAIKQETLDSRLIASVTPTVRQTLNTSSYQSKTADTSGLKQPQNGTGSLQTSPVPPINNGTRNVKNGLTITESGSESEISKKHEIFLKKLLASFDLFSQKKNKGIFCSVCDIYELYHGKPAVPPTFLTHEQTEKHIGNLGDKTGVKRHYCSQCQAHFFGDVKLWVAHLDMDLHKFFSDKRKSRQISNDSDDNEDNLLSEDKKSYAILIKGLPLSTKWSMVFNSLKDYGRVDKIEMDGLTTSAQVTFAFPRFAAWNLVKNEAPILIQNRKVEISLIKV